MHQNMQLETQKFNKIFPTPLSQWGEGYPLPIVLAPLSAPLSHLRHSTRPPNPNPGYTPADEGRTHNFHYIIFSHANLEDYNFFTDTVRQPGLFLFKEPYLVQTYNIN